MWTHCHGTDSQQPRSITPQRFWPYGGTTMWRASELKWDVTLPPSYGIAGQVAAPRATHQVRSPMSDKQHYHQIRLPTHTKEKASGFESALGCGLLGSIRRWLDCMGEGGEVNILHANSFVYWIKLPLYQLHVCLKLQILVCVCEPIAYSLHRRMWGKTLVVKFTGSTYANASWLQQVRIS